MLLFLELFPKEFFVGFIRGGGGVDLGFFFEWGGGEDSESFE